jgi:phage-related tail protein
MKLNLTKASVVAEEKKLQEAKNAVSKATAEYKELNEAASKLRNRGIEVPTELTKEINDKLAEIRGLENDLEALQ